jgi:endonuclease-3
VTRPARRTVPWKLLLESLERRLAEQGSGRPLPSVSAIARSNSDPFRVLVSTMISLRTKDEVTLRASEALLSRAGSPQRLAAMPESRIARIIYPAGFYRTKAAHLRAAARIIVSRHGGSVPPDMDQLLELPGVGRKTANLVRNLGFGLPGICVDTHVHRISNRMGWVSTRSPAQTEEALMRVLPRRYWIPINELLVRYGQAVCTPLSPRCSGCPAVRWCARSGVGKSR